MNKDRVIRDLRAKLEGAEEEIEYNITRKEELKKEVEEANDEIRSLEEKLKYANNCYDNYFQQARNLANEREELKKQLNEAHDELRECQEGNFFIQQYNNKLVKERDEADASLENIKKDKEESEKNINLLREENLKPKTQIGMLWRIILHA